MLKTLIMKRHAPSLLLILVLIVLCAAPCLAQSGKKSSQPSTGTIEPGTELLGEIEPDEHEPEVWKQFTSVEGRFKALFPGVPEDKPIVQEIRAGKVTGHQYQLVTTMALYEVSFADVPFQIDKPESAKTLLDAMRADALDSYPGKLLSESDITIEGHPGRDIAWRTDKGALLKSRYILSGNRSYKLLFGFPENIDSGRPEESPDDTRRFLESVGTKFFDSFKLSSESKR